MTYKTARMKGKGQITVPVELRRKFDLDTGSRVLFEDRGDYIAILNATSIVDRLAGSLTEYSTGQIDDFDRDKLWGEIAEERFNRSLQPDDETISDESN